MTDKRSQASNDVAAEQAAVREFSSPGMRVPMSALSREQAPSVLSRPPFWTRLLSRPMQFALDISLMVTAFACAYLLRFEFALPAGLFTTALIQLPLVVLVQLGALLFFGAYAFVWRYVGIAELPAFARAGVASTVLLASLRLLLPDDLAHFRIPISVVLIDAGLAFFGVMCLRVLRRILYENYEKSRMQKSNRAQKAVLFVGAGRAGVMAAREVLTRGDLDIAVKGFVDDDVLKHGTVIHGIRVLGPTAALPDLVREHGIDHVVVTIARASRGAMRRILSICDDLGVKVRVIPGLFELLDGKVEVSRIRDVQIDDLLGRDPVSLDEAAISAFVQGKVVCVTGAGGSIGSELCRQVARYAPRALVLFEQAENALFMIERELLAAYPAMQLHPVVGDVLDPVRINAVLRRHAPDVVFHAAAHKHVPLMEQNPGEAVKNNVLGTRRVADACDACGVSTFVMISTDKAVNPTSVMGTTKRVAELYVQALATRSRTRFVAVRFGNVLGSNGSVVPIFKEQIARGGPVLVTHPDMRRYFMTIPEAAQLVLQAGTMGQGGEIFVLDMGEPVKIVDLARDLILLSGLRPGIDIQIEFSGLRPGEKLYEEIAVDDENVDKTRHPKIFVGRLRGKTYDEMDEALARLASHVDDADAQALLLRLRELVPEFGLKAPTEAERNLVTRALTTAVAS